MAKTGFYQTCCYLIPKAWLKGAASLQTIVGPLLGVFWGGYEECCGHRKEMLDLFQWVRAEERAVGRKTEPGKGPQTSV